MFVAFNSSRKFAVSVAGRDAVATLRMAATKFETEFGFPPPLVRDQAMPPIMKASVEAVPGPAGPARFAVYKFSLDAASNAAHLAVLCPPEASLPEWSSDNPFKDSRFSERTVPFYLAGACDVPFDSTLSLPAKSIPIDGVAGPGFYKPRVDGTFEVPKELLKAAADVTRNRGAGSKFESFVDFSKRALTLYAYRAEAFNDEDTNGVDSDNFRFVELRDPKGTPIRYYRWISGKVENGKHFPPTKIDEYKLPPLVGRQGSPSPGIPADRVYNGTAQDRDIVKNPALRSAKFAIVAAGPDGAFGDEPLALLAIRLSKPVASVTIDERRIRVEAERDNIVEVGE